jgi:DedD protein
VNDVLKQRLVGALILLALGVVFWPIVFVQPEEKPSIVQRAIPQPPAADTTPIEAPDPAGLRASEERAADYEQLSSASPVAVLDSDGNQIDTDVPSPTRAAEPPDSAPTASALSEASTVRSEAPQRLAVDADGVPVAWTLQVATVSSYDKAEALRKRLLEKNEKAYVTSVSSGGKQLYRVCVGPKFERHELEKMQASINSEFGVKTMLVRYLP